MWIGIGYRSSHADAISNEHWTQDVHMKEQDQKMVYLSEN